MNRKQFIAAATGLRIGSNPGLSRVADAASEKRETSAPVEAVELELVEGCGKCGPAFSRLISRVVKEDKRGRPPYITDSFNGFSVKYGKTEWAWQNNWLWKPETGEAIRDGEWHLQYCYTHLMRLISKKAEFDLLVEKNRNAFLLLLDNISICFQNLDDMKKR